MLPAQLVNVAESALPPLPPVETFLKDLEKGHESLTSESTDTAIFGDTFVGGVPQPEGSTKNQKGAYAAVKNFQKVCEKKGWNPTNLDEYMVAFAKWVLNVDCLFDTEPEKIAAKAQRQVLCQEAGVPMYEWAPQTLTTYINALAVLHRQGRPESVIVPKAKKQFPQFVRFSDAAASRHKQIRARKPETAVLNDDDLLKLHAATRWDSWFDVQRYNILVLSFNIGQRQESLKLLRVGNFTRVTADDGQEMIKHPPVCVAFLRRSRRCPRSSLWSAIWHGGAPITTTPCSPRHRLRKGRQLPWERTTCLTLSPS